MRIIAGTYRSRILKNLKGLALRPTSDRLRETLFNVLGPSVENCRFLDIFAGTGAVGIEALSRGAAEVIFIENHLPAAGLIRHNLKSLAIKHGATVLPIDALKALQKLGDRKAPRRPFDIAYLDPPYAAKDEYDRILQFLGSPAFASANLGPTAIVIAEHRRSLELPDASGALHCTRILRQGDATLTFYRPVIDQTQKGT
jgi:16S rRNA (guanine(966)-N(2))-methyltransferase RsmD